MRDEIGDFQTAKERAEGNRRMRSALRVAMAFIVVIYLGLAYSLSYVKPGDAEYVVSILTLSLNTLLFGGVLAASIALKRRSDAYRELMKKYEREDRADPWRVG